MANEKRLIDANVVLAKQFTAGLSDAIGNYYGHADVVFVNDIENAPTVDAVEVDDMREFAQDVAYQFGCYCESDETLCLYHMGLSTLEWAFDILGWEDLHPVPECECEIDGCHRHATCGTPTKDGYKRVCGKHFNELHSWMS